MVKPISPKEYEMLATFRYALRQFLRFSETAARQAGITPQQHQTLLAIVGSPNQEPVTASKIAEHLQIRHHSAVGLIDRLVAQDLVAREPSQVDRREVYISLTQQGHAILTQLSTAHREELRRIGPQLHLILEYLTAEDLLS
ncbi:MAG: MarR family transcriptional regulator [Caldilineaceae bacterium]|nr:MarR family transcriptional regulator [Caldilineaceae bacterium]